MSLDLILKNATVITPQGEILGDLGIEGGKIVQIGDCSGAKAKSERDCTGLFILPGLIDMHVHFRDPGATHKEDFESGSRAAVAAGVTTVIDMPNTDPPTVTAEALAAKRQIAAQKSHANFAFYIGYTGKNFDEIRAAQGIAGVKAYMAPSNGSLFVEDVHLLEPLFELGLPVIVHAEDPRVIQENEQLYHGTKDPDMHALIRSEKASYEAVREVLHCAKKCDGRVHITHVSSIAEVQELEKFKSEKVTADVTPHHLFLTQLACKTLNNFAKVNPPLRSEKDRLALWEGLKNGQIQAIATDHAPHAKQEKQQPYQKAPSGVPGVETMLPLLLDAASHGQLNLQDVARFTAASPADILNIRHKGKIEVGFDADLVVVDMKAERKVGERGYISKCGWSPFEGKLLKGWPVMTIVGGAIVYGNGMFNEDFRGKEISL